ncbi:DUF1501 domain-containing protein [Fundidesulfovibrio terrae]|uniref:DUF1501 domain-containing protein n=1 Tax=Fundidesulfovibrio terrae TaxID=2922866 RepID=UPI001FAEB142|nr:DUF1501 domain-containing protein [Fundidesulfovibrio terrae]
MKRREFLSTMGVAALGAAASPALAWAQAAPSASKRLIVIFLRGGLDGLSAVAPIEDRWYYQARPSIALPPPGQEGGTIPLAPGFGLHPALEPLMEFWHAGSLAMVPACGLPKPLRSHAEAQKAMESAQPAEVHVRDGWLARLLPLLGKEARALTLASTPPLIGQGKPGVQNVRPTGYPPSLWRLERPAIFGSFDQVYAGNDPLGRAYRQTQIVLRNKLTELDREITVSASGAPSVHALPQLGGQIVSFVERNPATRLVYAALGGLDAHFEQGAGKGKLAEAFVSLGKGLAGLAKALGPGLSDTAVLVMSEFGRGLRENEFAGTDNGHGTLFMLLGGNAAGGALHGAWPGLSLDKLSDGLDLAVTVDFRDVIAQVVTGYFGLGKEALAQVLPGYMPTSPLQGLFKA